MRLKMKKETKELFLFIAISIKNIFIALLFTVIFGIYNTVIFRTMTYTYGDITWEVVIFIGLSLFDCILYNVLNKN